MKKNNTTRPTIVTNKKRKGKYNKQLNRFLKKICVYWKKWNVYNKLIIISYMANPSVNGRTKKWKKTTQIINLPLSLSFSPYAFSFFFLLYAYSTFIVMLSIFYCLSISWIVTLCIFICISALIRRSSFTLVKFFWFVF